MEENKQTENGEDSLAKRPVRFIKNPLPGPKPHVKKEMNYDYAVPPDKRFFVMATRENLPQGNNPQKRKKNMCKLDK